MCFAFALDSAARTVNWSGICKASLVAAYIYNLKILRGTKVLYLFPFSIFVHVECTS